MATFTMFIRKYSLVLVAVVTAVVLILTPAVASAKSHNTSNPIIPVPTLSETSTIVIYEELPDTINFYARQGTPLRWEKIEATPSKNCTPCWDIILPQKISRFRVYDPETEKSSLYAIVRIEPFSPLLGMVVNSKTKNWKPPARLMNPSSDPTPED